MLHKDLHTTVLLETMAGKGTEVGRSFEELAAILSKVQLNEKMGVCLIPVIFLTVAMISLMIWTAYWRSLTKLSAWSA